MDKKYQNRFIIVGKYFCLFISFLALYNIIDLTLLITKKNTRCYIYDKRIHIDASNDSWIFGLKMFNDNELSNEDIMVSKKVYNKYKAGDSIDVYINKHSILNKYVVVDDYNKERIYSIINFVIFFSGFLFLRYKLTSRTFLSQELK